MPARPDAMPRPALLALALVGLVVLMVLLVPTASAQLRLPLVLSDGAVLQRDRPVPIWGWAAPGAEVSVALGGADARATAGADGRWRVEMPPMPAGGAGTLTVTSGGERAEARDLLVGDVWVLSGQSNMEWRVVDASDADAEIAGADDAQIRHFKVPQSSASTPQDELAGGAWAAASPETVAEFSAVGYAFARDLRQDRDVPIGLVNVTWGGSRIEPWMSAEMLGLDAADLAAIEAEQRSLLQTVRDRLRETIGSLPETDAGLEGGVALWADPDLDDAGWAVVPVPSIWENAGYEGLDGVAWYRTTVTLTPEEAAAGVTVGVGRIDDDDVTWVNGVEIGGMENAWSTERRYAAPPSALRAGDNVLAVRVTDHGFGGGIAGEEDLVYVETADGARRSLAGDWRFRAAVVRPDAGVPKNQIPRLLWNRMVAPLAGVPVTGVLWYQGESNGDNAADAVAYRDLFQTMIEGWRDAWGQPDLPFFWVQLAAFRAPPTGPDDTGVWPVLRESQSAALALPNTAEAVTLDVGDAVDIQPRDKRTVGRRLALAARALVYGEDVTYSGPRYRDHEVRDGRVVVAFDHVGGGLMTRGGAALGGFALAGADGWWREAAARVEGDRVVVSSPAVSEPVAVRYAWADNPEAATLMNAEGLPAAPFQVGDVPPRPAR